MSISISRSKDRKIVLYGIYDTPLEIHSKMLRNAGSTKYVHECIYTSILNNLSVKRTKNNKNYYYLLDEKLNYVISIKDINMIKQLYDIKSFKFIKKKKIYGIRQISLLADQNLNSRISVSKYMISKYEDAFYESKDYLMHYLTFNMFNYGPKKLLKYSEGLYDNINKYLNNKNSEEKNNKIENIINVMDEMFLISPSSEDNMTLYMGNLVNTKTNKLEYGINNSYLMATSDQLSVYKKLVGFNEFYNLIMFIAIHIGFNVLLDIVSKNDYYKTITKTLFSGTNVSKETKNEKFDEKEYKYFEDLFSGYYDTIKYNQNYKNNKNIESFEKYLNINKLGLKYELKEEYLIKMFNRRKEQGERVDGIDINQLINITKKNKSIDSSIIKEVEKMNENFFKQSLTDQTTLTNIILFALDKMSNNLYVQLTIAVTSYLISRKNSNVCCFLILHLDDDIPYIKMNGLYNNNSNEILLPRGLISTIKKSDFNYKMEVKSSYLRFFELIGMNSKIQAHHIHLSLSDELKKKYKKKEKCMEYQVFEMI